ncbi:unnamed protein product [Mytilus edulis]|uniref:Uncharacterized protein n=1 Tax=Mytilus edulis TaxID=6550 RepID=A0A8S3RAJ0_MYTED|nr:unnamed protein product [Mytilus edulis]
MCEDQEKVLLPFQSPCCIQIVGPTQSGKTMLTYKILAQSKYLFTKTPKKTIYCYSAYQDLFSEMERKIENITFHEGLPTSEEIDKWSENKEHMILCLDDLLCQAANSSDVLNLFTTENNESDKQTSAKEEISPREDIKTEKDSSDDLNTLIELTIPVKYREKAKTLLQFLQSQSTISWNKHGKVKINNETVPNSHIVDLLRDVVIPYGCKQLPSGHEIFYDFLKNIHIPMGLISNRMRKQLVQSDIQTTEENEQLAESEPEKNKKRKINKLFVRRELSRLFEEKPKLKWKRFKL